MINKNIGCYLLSILIILLPINLYSDDQLIVRQISKHLETLQEFDCNFIQLNPDGSVAEGNLIYSKNRIRINYSTPYKITFIAKRNKAMYFNEDLMEVEYFNPKKTILNVFESIFNLTEMPKDSYEINSQDKIVEVFLKEIETDEIKDFSILFENNPMTLKKIQWNTENGRSKFTIFNLNKNIVVDQKTFSMVSPIKSEVTN